MNPLLANPLLQQHTRKHEKQMGALVLSGSTPTTLSTALN